MSRPTSVPVPQGGFAADEDNVQRWKSPCPFCADWKRVFLVQSLLLLASLGANVWWIRSQFSRPPALYDPPPTRYEIVPPAEYSSLNRTLQDETWNSPRLVSWDLFVALDEEYVVAQGLPHSQRWPWDSSKGVYILYAAHELHCVQVLWTFVNEKQDKAREGNLTWDYAHALHCLNILRYSVMCNANDQPLYTGRLHDNVHFKQPLAGRGTVRMCRSWDALMAWSHARSACYSSAHRDDPDFQELDRYKFCPDRLRL